MSGNGVVAAKCPTRVRLSVLRACAAALVLWLLVYTVTRTDVIAPPSFPTWNLSGFLQGTTDKLRLAIERPTGRKTKLVLLWTNYFAKENWLPSTLDLRCPVTECATTSDRSLLPNSSAVVLHWRNVDTNDLPRCSPSEDPRCPPWVLFNKEAPPHTNRDSLQAIQGNVRWVATYRRDSDIFAPYGRVSMKEFDNSKPVYNPNKRLVCWLVSNCATPSKREEFVSELENFIEVDTYGNCGHMKCPHPSVLDCYRWLSDRCLFYLSFENSICRDYTTEKLYNALSTDMVPVVLGNASNYMHLPQGSYINAVDFPDPKALAEYLVRVGRDRKLYLSYFSWKRVYQVKDFSYRWYCDLCAKLHSPEAAANFTPRGDLVTWWYQQSNCVSWQKS